MIDYADKITIYGNSNLNKTLDEITKMSEIYQDDMKPFRNFDIKQMFDFISKKIDYKEDPKGHEMIMRPKVLLKRKAGDCDDKTIMFLAWLNLTGGNLIKITGWGFSIVCEKGKKNFHHIFPFVIINNNKYDIDATYSRNKIFDSKHWIMRKNYITARV